MSVGILRNSAALDGVVTGSKHTGAAFFTRYPVARDALQELGIFDLYDGLGVGQVANGLVATTGAFFVTVAFGIDGGTPP